MTRAAERLLPDAVGTQPSAARHRGAIQDAVLRPARPPHGADAGRASACSTSARRVLVDLEQAEEDLRWLAGGGRRRDPRVHAVQHRLSLAGAAAGGVQPALSPRRRERARRCHRSSRPGASRGARSISRSSSARCRIAGSGCDRCSWMKWWRSSRRDHPLAGRTWAIRRACSRRSTC